MIQLIVYSLLIFLTLLAVADIISSCMEDDGIKKRCRIFAVPYYFVKNRLKGRQVLKDESTPTELKSEAKPNTVYETV